MSPEITPFTNDDYDDALALWQRSEGIGLRAADSREGIARYLARNPGTSYVARDGGALIGVALCGHDGRSGYLHHLAVAESHRRHRIGTALVRQCLAALRAQGFERCHLFLHDTNDAAYRFWQDGGWLRRGNLIMMSRDLGE